jgi:hypothetical protein
VALVLAEYLETIEGPGGTGFRARALALPTRTGLWEGWIEFNPTNGDPTFRSPNETLQPSRISVADWAATRTPRHLADALDRAMTRLGYSVRGYAARKAG